MSFSQITTVGLIGAVSLVIGQTVMGSLFPSPAIVFNALSYSHGLVTVDRTVNAESPFLYTNKLAELVNKVTGERVCKGSSQINMTRGPTVGQATLQEWIGKPEFGYPVCDPAMIPPGTYQMRAIYVVGSEQYLVEGEVFTLPEEKGAGR